MSFDVNVLSSKPVIKPAASMQNDGGGGNLGYMYQGRRQQEESQNIFAKNNEIDSFVNAPTFEAEDFNFSFIDFILEVWDAIKSFFRRK
ncbi:MAG: hypothetical protein NC390_03645 [Fusobacterium sp.]|nr:hypothetical protein [Fusobacterium sp.]